MKIRIILLAVMALMLGSLPGNTLAGGLSSVVSDPQEETVIDSLLADDEIVAYSDTADVEEQQDSLPARRSSSWTLRCGPFVHKVLSNGDYISLAFVLLVLFTIFVLLPAIILLLILYFGYKNRKNRMRLAEQALKSGQPLSDNILPQRGETADDIWQKGIRQLSLGLGLIVLLGISAGKIGVGVGLLVSFIGLGNIIIAKRNRDEEKGNTL